MAEIPQARRYRPANQQRRPAPPPDSPQARREEPSPDAPTSSVGSWVTIIGVLALVAWWLLR